MIHGKYTIFLRESKYHILSITILFILLLITQDFIAFEYCYDIEMTHALERHKKGEARVTPIIILVSEI